MKRPALKKDVAFIIALVMFSIMPALMNAQKICPDGHCPKGLSAQTNTIPANV